MVLIFKTGVKFSLLEGSIFDLGSLFENKVSRSWNRGPFRLNGSSGRLGGVITMVRGHLEGSNHGWRVILRGQTMKSGSSEAIWVNFQPGGVNFQKGGVNFRFGVPYFQ